LEKKALQQLYQILKEWKYTYTCVLKLPFTIDLQHKVGQLVHCITSCPSIVILENTLN
jgi:hypothetical protein